MEEAAMNCFSNTTTENTSTVVDEVTAETTCKHHPDLPLLDQMANCECQHGSNPNALPRLGLHGSSIAIHKNQKRETNVETRPTRHIPIDVVESILTRMNPKDAVRLGVVCKDWRAATIRFDPTTRRTPWLIIMKPMKTTCRLRSIVDKEVSFEIEFHGFPTERASFSCCSHGWLVSMPGILNPIHLLNPFSGAWLQLPVHELAPSFLCMSSAPTTRDCALLAHDHYNFLYVWRPGDESWTKLKGPFQHFSTILSFEGQFYTWDYCSGLLTIFQGLPFRLRELLMRNHECQQDSITDALPPVPQKFAVATDKNRKREIDADADADAKPTRYIPIDIVESILMRMNPKYAVRLSVVCKDWRAVAARLEQIMRKTPWLIVSKYPKKTFRLRSVVNKEVSFKIKVDGFPMSRSMFFKCSYGWLVTDLDLCNPMILFNPFSGVWLELPAYDPTPSFLCMSSAPTAPDCILLAHDCIGRLYVWRPGHKFWTIEKGLLEDFDTMLSFEGKFYAWHWRTGCLTIFKVLPLWFRKLVVPCPMDFTSCREPIVSLVESCGNILLLAWSEEKEEERLKEHMRNENGGDCVYSISFTSDYISAVSLVESSGNILLVCITKLGHESLGMYVFRFDLENKVWIKVESLGDRALFMDPPPYSWAISVSTSELRCHDNYNNGMLAAN
ncbi:F-box Kelch-repeat protein [Musa troglodytarum]|uniref:F-box Kelch-repeat protein n=1 Tax=Musa troglodytarum TaxID=320322 RepID=A0A9E7KLN3_9LILI|nr:F-box Kelch-repeat protein [Musa troglodytarum]